MKKLIYFSFCAVLLWAAASCSQEESVETNSTKSTLSFGAVLNDLVNNKAALKQQLADLPNCSDAVPAYVEVVLNGTTTVGTMDNPLVVEVNSQPGDFDNDGHEEYFTEESSSLELDPGAYSLEFFAVYDADDNLIWLAPYAGGDFEVWVDTPLPVDFNLGAGAKKYLDVDVLCFDDRVVNEYGYPFFDIPTVVAIEFCIHGNFCDENGRHSVENYVVSIWSGTDASGIQLYENVPNEIGINSDGDPFFDPICLSLPDTQGTDSYYVEITQEGELLRYGVITDAQVRALFDGEENLDFYHFREGNCNLPDWPVLLEEGE